MVATTAAPPQAGATETSYAFAQQPRAVSNRQKFREPAQQAAPASGGSDERLAVNIMWDRYSLMNCIIVQIVEKMERIGSIRSRYKKCVYFIVLNRLYCRRVVRGNTYAAQVLPAVSQTNTQSSTLRANA